MFSGRFVMKKGYSIIAAFILTAGLGFTAFAEEEKVEMQIISIPEQNFSTLVSPDYVYSFHPDGGLNIYLNEEDEETYVNVYKTDSPGSDFNTAAYFENVYAPMLADEYGTDLVNPGEYKEFPIAGEMLPGQMCTYRTAQGTGIRFCVYDLESDYFVRYEAFGTDETAGDAIGALGVAFGNFQPDAEYYGSSKQAETGDADSRSTPSDSTLADDEISSSILELLGEPGSGSDLQGSDTDSQGSDNGTMFAGDEGDTLISQRGIEVHVTSYKIEDYGPSMRVYIYAANDTDCNMFVSAKNASVNGIPVRSAGFSLEPYSEIGDDSEYLLFLTSDEDPETSGAAIENPLQIELDLDVLDLDQTGRGFVQHVFIDLTAFVSKNPDSTGNDTGNDYDSSPDISYAPAYTPSSYDFRTLDIGSSGQDVTDLQQRLTDLGYLCDKVDGIYGKNTATAVMSFNAQHGRAILGEAAPDMQELLYSSSAEYYVEPYIPLVIGPQFQYDHSPYADIDLGRIWIQVVNRNMDRPIIGYELYYYQEDVYGDRYIEPNTGVELTMTTTLQQTIKPGYIEYSEPVAIMHWAWTYRVYVGIHKIVFEDGEVREIDPDDITYFSLDIKS